MPRQRKAITTARKRSAPEISLNLNIRGLTESSTLAINRRSNQLLSQGRQVFKLGLGQSPFPVPDPVVQALQRNAFQKDYLPCNGLGELRREVAGYHRRTQGLGCREEDVLIGPGSKELMFILQLVYYGDLVIPAPSWVSYAPQAQIIGRRIHWIPTALHQGWGVQPEEIEKLCRQDPSRPRILILNYPGNPSGGTYTTESLQALARLAKRFRVILLSDEIYGELHHRGQHVSIARFYPEGTIISSGISKWCGAGGWRLGTFTFPPDLDWLRDTMSAVASETYTSTSAPIQYAAVTAFRGGPEIDAYLAKSRRILGALARHLAHRLSETGVWVPAPKGGFYLFPDLEHFRSQLAERGIRSSEQLCLRLLEETGVATLPGSVFGRPEDELTLRLSYVDFDGRLALKECPQNGAKIGRDYLLRCCRPTLEGVERLCEWLRRGPA